tara:strand:- start:151 stop:561 length:411 start_codon:yes stop_codon:yes gene_type:complete
MFGQFLLEQGVEIELPVGINTVLGFLDEEIPKFKHKEYCYDIGSCKSDLKTEWQFTVKARMLEQAGTAILLVAILVLEKSDDMTTLVKIPPVIEGRKKQAGPSENQIELFSGFVFQMLNGFRSYGLSSMPESLPVA